MDAISHFRSLDELVKMLDRERVLFRDMFERRKSLNYRLDFALEVVDYKRDRIRYLIDHGVIHENGDFLELEDVYIQFFEDVLDMNEEISVASVKEYIDSIRENINYFLQESNEHRKYQYRCNVRKILRKIGLRTLKNIIDLKRNVNVAYKQEPNYKIKKTRLANLDEKRKAIKVMMSECERMMDEQVVFFRLASDPEMQRTCMDVRNDFTEADPLDDSFLADDVETLSSVNTTQFWNAFKAQGNHLFAFILTYPYSHPRSLNDHIVLFCQLATQHSDELRFTDEYDRLDKIEYALIYAK